jgi:uncharacterized protein (TIGR01244 family)
MNLLRSLVILACAGASLPAGAGQLVTTENVPGITNFRRVASTIACAGATTPESLRGLKEMGFASVVNLRQATETGANVEEERAAALAAGLRYIHIPMNGAAPDPAVLDQFLDAAKDPENAPMFVHCATGNRAASVWLVKRVLVDGWGEDRAVEEAQGLGLTSAGLKAFALDYIKTHPRK